MHPLVARYGIGAAVVLVVVVIFLPELLRPGETPLRPGGRLIYGINELQERSSTAYPLRLMLHARPSGVLELQVKSEHGERLIEVDEELAPLDFEEHIEFPLSDGTVIEPGALWLPGKDRRVHTIGRAGYVRQITRYKAFTAVEVEAADGGARYFDLETGMLVGFEIQLTRRRQVVGSLLSLK